VPTVVVFDGIEVFAGANGPSGSQINLQVGHMPLEQGRAYFHQAAESEHSD
jgi:hypothetical protein